jgi:hypothetical protein
MDQNVSERHDRSEVGNTLCSGGIQTRQAGERFADDLELTLYG